MKNFDKLKKSVIVYICLITLVVLILCPLVMIFKEAIIVDGRLDLSNMFHSIFEDRNITTIVNSLVLSVVVVVISTVIALPVSFIISKTQIGRHKWIDIVIMIPFMTPPYISSMGWILFMQKRGLLQQLVPGLSNYTEKFFCFFGLAFIMSLHVFPFMVTILKNALINVGGNLEQAAAVFGANFKSRLIKIVFPLITGNYAIGALLVFVKTLSEYGTPATFGHRIGYYVFTTDIHRYSTVAPIDFGKSASLSSVLIGICLLMWFMQNYITNKKSYNLVGAKSSKQVILQLKPLANVGAWSYLIILFLVAVGIPYFSVIVTSLIKLRGYGLAKGNFTFINYINLFTENPKGKSAIITSTILAFSSATISAVIGTVIVTILRQTKSRFKKIIEAISLLPEMLPGIVLVIGLILFWNGIYKIIPIYNTLLILVLAYVVLYLPYTIQYVMSAYTQINDNIIVAGKTFGGTDIYVFLKITFPLIFKGVISAWIMTFIISFRELVAASMLAPPNTLTISTFILREFEQGSVSIGMAMAVICVLLTMSVLIVLNYFTSKEK